MMRGTLLGLVVVLSTFGAGCAKKRVPPPVPVKLDYGPHQATYRDWSIVSPCDVHEATLIADLTSLDPALDTFLNETAPGANGQWDENQLRDFEGSPAKLGPAIEAAERIVRGLTKCRVDSTLKAAAQKSGTKIGQAQKRMTELNAAVAAAQARAGINTWKSNRPALFAKARKAKCRGKTQVLFYASQDDEGVTEWYFCDEFKVVQPPAKLPEVVGVTPAAKKKKPNTKIYLEAITQFPAANIDRCPMPGATPAAAPVPKPASAEAAKP